jgi:quinoprotein glucose dehydrogenase
MLWTVQHIPRPGEFGNDTWDNESWAVTGNTGVWNQIAVDEDLGLAYLPVETPSSDFYGGLRPGNNLFARASSRSTTTRPAEVAFPARAPSDLEHGHRDRADARRSHGRRQTGEGGRGDGQAGDAVPVRSRHGVPIFPIEERPVPQVRRAGREDVADAAVSDEAAGLRSPGRHARQPDRLHAGTARGGAEDRGALQDRSDLHAAAGEQAEGPIAAFRSSGGTNWPGGRTIPRRTSRTCRRSRRLPILGLLPPPNKEFSDVPYVSANVLTGVRYISGPGEGAGADSPARSGGRGTAPAATTTTAR